MGNIRALYGLDKRAAISWDDITKFVSEHPKEFGAGAGALGGGLLGRLVSGNWKGGLLGSLLGGGAGYAGGGWWQANRLGAALQAQNKSMQTQLHGAGTKIVALNKQLSDEKARALTAAQSAKSRQDELQAARDQWGETETGYKNIIAQHEANIGKLNTQAEANAKTIAELMAKGQQFDTDRAQWSADRTNYENTIGGLNAQIQQLTEAGAQSANELERIRAQADAANARAESLNKQLNDAKAFNAGFAKLPTEYQQELADLAQSGDLTTLLRGGSGYVTQVQSGRPTDEEKDNARNIINAKNELEELEAKQQETQARIKKLKDRVNGNK